MWVCVLYPLPARTIQNATRVLSGFELGPVLSQKRSHVFGQELAKVTVDGQFPGQRLDPVLTFETA